MMEYDGIVVGGGLAGLIAAATAARRNKKVLLLAKGAGVLAFSNGSIDLLGYTEQGEPLPNPLIGLTKLSSAHPYKKMGEKNFTAAVVFFLDLCREAGYPYVGEVGETLWLPTAAGTLKPSCLVPKTMHPGMLHTAKEIIIIDFHGLKDYFPDVIVKGLQHITGYKKHYKIITVDPGLADGRDVTALDIARWLETEQGQAACIAQLRAQLRSGDVALIPPVLGMCPDYHIVEKLEKSLDCHFVELIGMPPAVTGLRLRNLLLSELRKQGVKIIENAEVARAVIEDGRCTAVVTRNLDRERTYRGKACILATGGFWGGGLTAGPGFARETIFNLPITGAQNQEEWGLRDLFGSAGQPFARMGVLTDECLRPIDGSGRAIYANVYIAGRNLSGYDYCLEKSGNGVALVSGYQAGMSI
jgi:glycerol-3-phosphate dehydrogenase subunit B